MRLVVSALTSKSSSARERIIGIPFWNATAADAVEEANLSCGCVVVPASPALIKLNYDEGYRTALRQADVVLPDSQFLGFLWKLVTGHKLTKISGIDYLSVLVTDISFREGKTLWIVRSEAARAKTIEWLESNRIHTSSHTFAIVTSQNIASKHHALLLKSEEERPKHIVLALRGGGQEELGIYLRDYLLRRPTIHCVGAALGFLTGDGDRMPAWAQRRHLGWLARLGSQPRMFFPRIAISATLAWMIFRYRSELPPLQTRWTDV